MWIMKVVLIVFLLSCVLTMEAQKGPYFKKSPVSTVKAYVGDRVRLKCDVRGHPRPFLHWYKGSKLIKHTQSVSISGNTLTIRSVRGEDGGNYACNAQNPIGEIWGNVSLIVHLRQRPIIEGPTNQTVLVGQPLVLTCKDILDDHMTNLKWVKHYKVHGLYTALDGKPYVTVVQTVDETRNPEKFSIDNVTMDDAGWYTCIAENTFGVSYKSAYVEVLPGQISDTVENQNATIPNQQLELGLVHQQLDALNSTLMRVVSEQSRMRSVISRLVKQAKLKDRKTSRSRRKGRKGKGRLKRNRRPVLN